jgi:hypothetical protein
MWSTAYHDNEARVERINGFKKKKLLKRPLYLNAQKKKRTRQDPVNKKLPLI